jgi:hypothetical protein
LIRSDDTVDLRRPRVANHQNARKAREWFREWPVLLALKANISLRICTSAQQKPPKFFLFGLLIRL